MVKPLSQQLSELSVRAKKAEDDFAAAQGKASAQLQQTEAEIKAAAQQRKANMDRAVTAGHDTVVSTWDGLTTKMQSDIDGLRTKIDVKKYEHNKEKAAEAATDAEVNATRAINFALDSIDYAEVAVLDAVYAREAANTM
jgi:hypothetical protein